MHTKLDQEINFIVQRQRSLSMVVFVHLRRAYPIWVKALARMKQSVVVALITAQLVLTRTPLTQTINVCTHWRVVDRTLNLRLTHTVDDVNVSMWHSYLDPISFQWSCICDEENDECIEMSTTPWTIPDNWTHPDVPTIPTFPPITFPPISLPTPRPTPQDCSQYAHPNWYGDCVCDDKTTHVMKDDGKCYCIGYNFHSAPWACYACVCCTCLLCRILLVNW